MNLHKRIRTLYLKIRWFLYGYNPFDFNNDGEFGEISQTITSNEIMKYLSSFLIVIGIPLLIVSIILSLIFQNVSIFLITFAVLLGLFVFIVVVSLITALIMEIFLSSLFNVIEAYRKFFKKEK